MTNPNWHMEGNTLVSPPCETCGKPAIMGIVDYDTWGENGIRVATPKQGGIHYFCGEHQREPIETFWGE